MYFIKIITLIVLFHGLVPTYGKSCPKYIKQLEDLSTEAFRRFRKNSNEQYQLEAVFRRRFFDTVNQMGERLASYRLVYKILGTEQTIRLASIIHPPSLSRVHVELAHTDRKLYAPLERQGVGIPMGNARKNFRPFELKK